MASFGKAFFGILLVFFIPLFGQAQNYENPGLYAETILPIEIKGHVDFLASDELEGRLTGARGQKVAAKYIATRFQSYGLMPGVSLRKGVDGFFQKFKLVKNVGASKAYVKPASDKKLTYLEDFIFVSPVAIEPTTAEILLLDEKEVETKGNNGELKGKIVAVYGASISTSYSTTAANAYKKGAIAFVHIEIDPDKFQKYLEQMQNAAESKRVSMSLAEKDRHPFLAVNDAFVAKIFGTSKEELLKAIENKNYPTSEITLSVQIAEEATVISENVIGVLPGTDKKDEYVFITAHYDHEGIKEEKIYNGADDNASGVSAVLELAEAFAKAVANGERPRRSIVFMTVSGEEKGLLGSKYYVNHPIFPLKKIVADFNIDMVGRLDEKHEGNENYIYLIGSDRLSMDLHEISESVNEKYTSLELDYTFNAEDDPNRFYYRSDHYNFAKNNIPVIFYFNGVHDDYHQHTDTPDKILHQKIAHISTLIFHTVWEVANREDRIRLNGKDIIKKESETITK